MCHKLSSTVQIQPFVLCDAWLFSTSASFYSSLHFSHSYFPRSMSAWHLPKVSTVFLLIKKSQFQLLWFFGIIGTCWLCHLCWVSWKMKPGKSLKIKAHVEHVQMFQCKMGQCEDAAVGQLSWCKLRFHNRMQHFRRASKPIPELRVYPPLLSKSI